MLTKGNTKRHVEKNILEEMSEKQGEIGSIDVDKYKYRWCKIINVMSSLGMGENRVDLKY